MAQVGEATILVMGGFDLNRRCIGDGMVLNVEGAPRKEGTVAAQSVEFVSDNNSYCYTE